MKKIIFTKIDIGKRVLTFDFIFIVFAFSGHINQRHFINLCDLHYDRACTNRQCQSKNYFLRKCVHCSKLTKCIHVFVNENFLFVENNCSDSKVHGVSTLTIAFSLTKIFFVSKTIVAIRRYTVSHFRSTISAWLATRFNSNFFFFYFLGVLIQSNNFFLQFWLFTTGIEFFNFQKTQFPVNAIRCIDGIAHQHRPFGIICRSQ